MENYLITLLNFRNVLKENLAKLSKKISKKNIIFQIKFLNNYKKK